MSRVYIVVACCDCPRCEEVEDYEADETFYRCTNADDRRIGRNWDLDYLPRWCPLPTIKKFKEIK